MDVLLIAGLWLDGAVWAEVARRLEEQGHRAVPVALPGQDDGSRTAVLAEQVEAVVAAVDAADGPAMVVGHSAASSLAWIAADARPEKVATAVLVGGFPKQDGERYADYFPVEDGAMPFPGWEPFAGPDSADLDPGSRRALEEAAIPVPEGVAHGAVRLRDERRYDVPIVIVCPEFTADEARSWVEGGEAPELARARHVSYVDVETGHWPMVSAPAEFADALAGIAGS